MCTGIEVASLIGVATAAAGTGVSMKASADARSASNKVIENSLLQQQQFQKEASPLFQQSLAGSTANEANRNIQTGADESRSLYNTISKVPQNSGTSPLPVDEQRLAGQVSQSRENAAQAQGYANMGFQNWLRNQNAFRNLNVISGLASSAAAPTATLAQLAQQKSAGLAGIGSLMSTAGNLAAIYGGLNSQKGSTISAIPSKNPAPGLPTM